MSFDIHASRTSGFRHKDSNCADGDVFEAHNIMSALWTMGSSLVGVGEGIAEYALPNEGEGIQNSLATIALAKLHDALQMLSGCPNNLLEKITVTAVQTHRFWPDTSEHAEYAFPSVDNPGAEFMETIRPALEATDLQNYGVLMKLANVLALYAAKVGAPAPQAEVLIFLNITLTA